MLRPNYATTISTRAQSHKSASWQKPRQSHTQTTTHYTQISDHAVLRKQDSIASAADHADSAYHTYTVTKQRYGTYNLSKGNSFVVLLDTSSVGVRVQEESTHVPLRLKRILLWLTLLRFHYLLLLADVVIVVQAILVRTHGFRIFILLRRYIWAFDV